MIPCQSKSKEGKFVELGADHTASCSRLPLRRRSAGGLLQRRIRTSPVLIYGYLCAQFDGSGPEIRANGRRDHSVSGTKSVGSRSVSKCFASFRISGESLRQKEYQPSF